MKKIIHNLRQQSEDVRKHILHLVTLFFAIILFVIWVYTLGTGFGDKDIQAKVKDDLEPFSVLKDNFINGYKSIQDNSLDIIE